MDATEAENTAIVRELIRELNDGHLDAISDYLVDDYGDGNDEPAPEEIIDRERSRREAFPEWEEQIMHLAGGDGTVLAQTDVNATHEGELFSIPATGREAEFAVLRLFQFEDGEITAWRSTTSSEIDILRQLGLDWEALQADLSSYMERPS